VQKLKFVNFIFVQILDFVNLETVKNFALPRQPPICLNRRAFPFKIPFATAGAGVLESSSFRKLQAESSLRQRTVDC
jgi:hypothetical protein